MTKTYPIVSDGKFLYMIDKEAKISPQDSSVWFVKEKKVKLYKPKLANYAKGLERVRPDWVMKILASNNPELGLPILELPKNQELEKLLDYYFPIPKTRESSLAEFFKAGYKAATKLYTEEDVIQAYLEGTLYMQKKSFYENFEQFFKSLNQPKIPVSVEVEMEGYIKNWKMGYDDADQPDEYRLKLVDNKVQITQFNYE